MRIRIMLIISHRFCYLCEFHVNKGGFCDFSRFHIALLTSSNYFSSSFVLLSFTHLPIFEFIYSLITQLNISAVLSFTFDHCNCPIVILDMFILTESILSNIGLVWLDVKILVNF